MKDLIHKNDMKHLFVYYILYLRDIFYSGFEKKLHKNVINICQFSEIILIYL